MTNKETQLINDKLSAERYQKEYYPKQDEEENLTTIGKAPDLSYKEKQKRAISLVVRMLWARADLSLLPKEETDKLAMLLHCVNL